VTDTWQRRMRTFIAAVYPDTVRVGDVFAAVESAIPIHTAFRVARAGRYDPSSPPAARWRAFVHELHATPVEIAPMPIAPESRVRFPPRRCEVCGATILPARRRVRRCAACARRYARGGPF
jgi:hypothetical protein